MTVKELVGILEQYDPELMVRMEDVGSENLWVHGAEEHKTGSSGYEIGGEVVLRIGE